MKKSSYWLGLVVLCGFTFFSSWVMAQEKPAGGSDSKWGPHFDVEAKLGSKRRLGELGMFVPLLQNDTTLGFADLRGRGDDKGSREGNLGLGVRRMLDSGWNLGAYGYFDRRRSENDNYFSQAAFGVEALSRDWDVRINGYVPLGDRIKEVESLNTATLTGTTVTFYGGEEHALAGFDGEIGWRVPVFDEDSDSQLRLYLGGYRFISSGVPDVQGPRARLDLTIAEIPGLWAGSRLSVGAEVQHDSPRGTQAFASLRLRIPLDLFKGGRGRRKLRPMERRMTEPVVRDIDVMTLAGVYGEPETVTELADGSTFTVLDDDTTTGAGLPGAVAAAGADSTVILSGRFDTTATTTLQSGQTIIGGGNLTVKSPSGRTATLSLPTATVSATIAGVGAAASNPAFMMADNSTLTGMNISLSRSGGSGAFGVYFTNVSGATLKNSTVSSSETGGNASEGVVVGDSTSNITIGGNTISAVGSAGQTAIGLIIADGGGGAAATVTGNTLSATGGTNNYAVHLNGATVNSGSTGNVKSNGTCSTVGGITGTIYFTDGTTCP